MDLIDILKVLADGEFHSGEELGQALGVSRTAVWKHLNKLDDLGLELVSIKGRGYCLAGGLDLLDLEAVRAGLNPEAQGLLGELQLHTRIDSTNKFLVDNGSCGDICLAEQQLQGRGRRGRAWVSPFARNIYFSVAWSFSGGAQALEGLSLAVGVKVADALAALGCKPLQLKWPNDLYSDGRKLGGILLEMSGDVSGDCKVVVGIGINVTMPAGAAEAIDQDWVDLRSIGFNGSRNQVVTALINNLMPLLANYGASGFKPYRAPWEVLDAFRGRAVALSSAQQRIEGVAKGVSDNGALLIETSEGLEQYSGGELSLRPIR
ncbi:MAG: bifunctional biotin--[acetyl-CoA-carboxylase] ligase/biotin operon repressor BirA [Cellvibrionaceae bacterium]|nr:bifunctional biotin--[acetyl-CoA-carboxylase] ligase/biotin operon repressor BirA [Cellvibrionaceae bacterium]MCV6624508.1 bifunctional biotin--[acetyl-CoA-carboxylase] ligase/biotin operon repressor BirA [Cellvibrionaceae bacterium]